MEAVRSVLIWGAGGHAKVVADLVRAVGHELVGHVDLDGVGEVVEPGGAAVVATQDELFEALAASDDLPLGADAVIVAIGDNELRRRFHNKLPEHYTLALIHPAATISPSARIGLGTVVFAGAVVNANAHIGAAVIVNTAVVVEHDCEVSDGVHLSPNAAICGATSVGAQTWVGAGSTVIHGIVVGADAVVGAGAVVIGDVSDGATVVGNPAKEIKRSD